MRALVVCVCVLVSSARNVIRGDQRAPMRSGRGVRLCGRSGCGTRRVIAGVRARARNASAHTHTLYARSMVIAGARAHVRRVRADHQTRTRSKSGARMSRKRSAVVFVGLFYVARLLLGFVLLFAPVREPRACGMI